MPREKQFNEEQAIQRFTKVFWQKGYNACSVGDLVAASGLSRSSLYDTFGDKEQLFIRCLKSYGAQTKSSLEDATKDKITALEKIEAVMLMPFSRPDGSQNCKGCLAVNTMSELDGTPNDVQQLIKNTKDGFEDFLIGCIKDGQANGEIIDHFPPESLAAMLYTNFCGSLILQKAFPDEASVMRNVQQILGLLKR